MQNTTKPRIEHLTDEQWAAVYDERREWLDRGMSTAPTDRDAVETAMAALYAAKGHPRPMMIWADSPLSAVAMGALCRSQLGGQLGGQLWDQLGDRLGAQLGAQLGGQLRDQLGGQLRGQLGDQLWGQLGGQLRDRLRDQLGGQLWGQLGGQRGEVLRNAIFSGWDVSWLAFYRIPEILGFVTYADETAALLDHFVTVATGAISWTPYVGFCFLSDRPTTIAMTGELSGARLHHPTGPAVTFADGWQVHAWNGTRVPAGLIEGTWTAADILREPNSEIRRCAIERMGWDRFVVDAGLAQVGDTVPDPGNPGCTLSLYDVPEQIYDEPVRVLLMTNGSPDRNGGVRRYGETVPADIDDPVAAAAWQYDVPKEVYDTLQRRT